MTQFQYDDEDRFRCPICDTPQERHADGCPRDLSTGKTNHLRSAI